MKVISFHSYKGGRGRTTAIASIANLYARSGKNVALLDLDVTAPWLHTRYDVSIPTLESKAWLQGLLRELAMTPPSIVPAIDLDDYSIRVDDFAQGSVRLLAPGNPETVDYWKWMAEEFPRFLGVRTDPHIIESWRDLRALIASANPAPDLLLIDAPAGYHQASAYVAMAIADTAVLFAQADNADATWTTQMVKMMREARPKHANERYGELKVIGVRARYPEWVHPDLDANDRFRSFQARYAEANFDEWISLESDPRIEMTVEDPAPDNPDAPIPLRGKFKETGLVAGYARLLATALGGDDLDTTPPLERLPAGDVLPGERPQFFLLEEQGILTNPADSARNVSFRVETFCGLLDDLHEELLGPITGAEDSAGIRALKAAGHKPGQRFGRSLREQLETMSARPEDEERIMRWCEFDSRVGFGGLNLEEIELDGDGDALGGVITVAGNFLAANRASESRDLCPLLAGYIEGVLSMLTRTMPSIVEVSHPPEDCMRGSDRENCKFRFAIPQQAPTE
jgi:cellulose biosynthesis protein BcsQ